jgi:RNA 2',3'-cyclic 3'-phosphodiesterase
MHLYSALSGAELPGRPVVPENWHLTLRFLGDTLTSRAERLRQELTSRELGPPVATSFGGFGAFPRPPRAAVLWLGFSDGAIELARLAERVETAVRVAGLPTEKRAFRPHLTLSRLRPPRDVGPLLENLPPFPGSLLVREVTLFRSHLGSGPPRYEPLARFPLAG